MPQPPTLPRFLISDDGDERDFVIHTQEPRFVAEVDVSTGQVVQVWPSSPRLAAVEALAAEGAAFLMGRRVEA
jgi:hypothetical protein